MKKDRGEAFERLVGMMRSEPRPLVLLGAGASVDSGYPSWTGLLATMREIASRSRGKLAPKAELLYRGLNDPAWEAEEYARIMQKRRFYELIRKRFGPLGAPGRVHCIGARIGFRHFLTTNYDPTIERALIDAGVEARVIEWNDQQGVRDFFTSIGRSDPAFLVYLHGRYSDPARVVLTESSYVERYVRSNDTVLKLFAILITQPIVFIGFSVSDPDFNQIMRSVRAQLGDGAPQHFVLTGYQTEEERRIATGRFRGKFGVDPVFYEILRDAAGGEDHRNLIVLLEDVYQAVHGRPSGVEHECAPPADTAVAAAMAAEHFDPLDPHRGRFGGLAGHSGRVLKVQNIRERRGYCTFDLIVESSGGTPLTGDVHMHLHPTFPNEVVTVTARNGKARLNISAWGAFTAGISFAAEDTRLELDLAAIEDFPMWFRER